MASCFGQCDSVGMSSCAPKGSGFDFQSAHTQVAGSIPSWGAYERQRIDFSLSSWFSHRCFSLSLKSIKTSSDGDEYIYILTHLFTYVYGCSYAAIAELANCNRLSGLQSLSYLLPGLL